MKKTWKETWGQKYRKRVLITAGIRRRRQHKTEWVGEKGLTAHQHSSCVDASTDTAYTDIHNNNLPSLGLEQQHEELCSKTSRGSTVIIQSRWSVLDVLKSRYSPGLCEPPGVDERPAILETELHRLAGEADSGGDAPITNWTATAIYSRMPHYVHH